MSARQWTDSETFHLISLYEENETLWNEKLKLYRSRDKRFQMYEVFAKKFNNCNAKEIQRKLHNLRNQVSHEIYKMRKMESDDGAGDKFVSKWKFFSALKFVIPFFMTRKPMSKKVTEKRTLESNKEVNEPTPPRTTRKEKRTNKRPSQSQDDEALEIMKKPKDDFDRFGEYVAFELKSLKSDYYRGLLKSEIRKAICNISDMDERSHWSNTTIPSPPTNSISTCSSPMPSSPVEDKSTLRETTWDSIIL